MYHHGKGVSQNKAKAAEWYRIRYLADRRTCVMPVKLAPGRTYVVWINRGKFDSFRDTGNNPAVPYLLVFGTGKAE